MPRGPDAHTARPRDDGRPTTRLLALGAAGALLLTGRGRSGERDSSYDGSKGRRPRRRRLPGPRARRPRRTGLPAAPTLRELSVHVRDLNRDREDGQPTDPADAFRRLAP
ncbi:hypothetical protein [Streptomyces heilongjiangensis]|uniref:Uncharacterized protein n=1 Tax=Streptomyces heilongjiangensis TaxID=945052 RepID=A0ABW1B6M3_9ACTN|nr:hypothetical protein [Streptomyces heilongjiangensis]MDC2949257.1 hypothetical protein [Streptomyces heilongjiangensis]